MNRVCCMLALIAVISLKQNISSSVIVDKPQFFAFCLNLKNQDWSSENVFPLKVSAEVLSFSVYASFFLK